MWQLLATVARFAVTTGIASSLASAAAQGIKALVDGNKANIHNNALRTLVQIGGDTAYGAFINMSQTADGKIDFKSTYEAAVNAGVKSAMELPAAQAWGYDTVRNLVNAGLASALKADPTVAAIPSSTVTVTAPRGETASATVGQPAA